MEKGEKAVIIICGILASIFFLGYFLLAPEKPVSTDNLEQEMMSFGQKNIQYYFNMDWCQVLVYGDRSVAHSNSDSSENCRTKSLRHSELEHFNIEDKKVFDDIERLLNDRFMQIVIEYASGTPNYAEFHERCGFCRTRYVYKPQYVLPPDQPGELMHIPINTNWYRVEEDWN
jgi:hypothetical protein